MRLQPLSLFPPEDHSGLLPDSLTVSRSDPVYNAHGYLTKVPVSAIVPFVRAFTNPGDVVLDPFAGSGMTGVAAAILGRRAELRDISPLGRHIGTNYVSLVPPEPFAEAAREAARAADEHLGKPYSVSCRRCEGLAQLSRRTWSVVFECRACHQPFNYYRTLERAGWLKRDMRCGACNELVTARSPRLSEEPVIDTISCGCTSVLIEQEPTGPDRAPLPADLTWPDVAIGRDRQMFQASALERHGLTSTARFFSERNLAALAALRQEIRLTRPPELREKLLFAFTAILARASKRYQWSRQRPLNASNHNYYIAPVFYEWNVFDLFQRKIGAAVRSDGYIRTKMRAEGLDSSPAVVYRLGSADALDLGDGSIDYVFTDPPFGSNIFYSDMNLFQEAWLGETTDPGLEAVVDRSGGGPGWRSPARYEKLLTGALAECRRVLKPDGRCSMVFSNSSGLIWALVQRSIIASGLRVDPERIVLLDKGQRSVKGLASGFESVVTNDLVLTLTRARDVDEVPRVQPAPPEAVRDIVERGGFNTASEAYLRVVRDFLRQNWDASALDATKIAGVLEEMGAEVEPTTARLISLTSEGGLGE